MMINGREVGSYYWHVMESEYLVYAVKDLFLVSWSLFISSPLLFIHALDIQSL